MRLKIGIQISRTDRDVLWWNFDLNYVDWKSNHQFNSHYRISRMKLISNVIVAIWAGHTFYVFCILLHRNIVCIIPNPNQCSFKMNASHILRRHRMHNKNPFANIDKLPTTTLSTIVKVNKRVMAEQNNLGILFTATRKRQKIWVKVTRNETFWNK